MVFGLSVNYLGWMHSEPACCLERVSFSTSSLLATQAGRQQKIPMVPAERKLQDLY